MATSKNSSIVPKHQVDLAPLDEAVNEVGVLSLTDFVALAKQNQYTLDMTVSLADGEGIAGTFIGEGAPQAVGDEKTNQTTGEVTRDLMRTWMLRLRDTVEGDGVGVIKSKGRILCRLIGKSGINAFLENVPAGGVTEVAIIRNGSKQLGKKTVNQYRTMSRPLTDGTAE